MQYWQIHRFFIKSIWRRLGFGIFSLLLLSLSFMIALMLITISNNVDEVVQGLLGEDLGLDTIRVFSNNANKPITNAQLEQIQNLNAVDRADPYISLFSDAKIGAQTTQLNLLSTNPKAAEIQRLKLQSGRSFQLTDHNAIILSQRTVLAMGIANPDSIVGQQVVLKIERNGVIGLSDTKQQAAVVALRKPPTEISLDPTALAEQETSVPQTVPTPLLSTTVLISPTQISTPSPTIFITATPIPAPTLTPVPIATTQLYTLTIIGIARQTPNDRSYISLELGLEIAAWQAKKTPEQFLAGLGYTGIQVIAEDVEAVYPLQRALANIALSSEASLDNAMGIKRLVEQGQIILAILLVVTLFLAISLICIVIWLGIRSSAQQVGTLLLVGATPKHMRFMLRNVALLLTLPSALLGFGTGWALLSILRNWMRQNQSTAFEIQMWVPLSGLILAVFIAWLTAQIVYRYLSRRTIAELLWIE